MRSSVANNIDNKIQLTDIANQIPQARRQEVLNGDPIQLNIFRAKKQLKYDRRHAKQLREDHMMACVEEAHLKNDKKKAKVIETM